MWRCSGLHARATEPRQENECVEERLLGGVLRPSPPGATARRPSMRLACPAGPARSSRSPRSGRPASDRSLRVRHPVDRCPDDGVRRRQASRPSSPPRDDSPAAGVTSWIVRVPSSGNPVLDQVGERRAGAGAAIRRTRRSSPACLGRCRGWGGRSVRRPGAARSRTRPGPARPRRGARSGPPPYREGSMSPPPTRSRPSKGSRISSGAPSSPGDRIAVRAPARRSASRYELRDAVAALRPSGDAVFAEVIRDDRDQGSVAMLGHGVECSEGSSTPTRPRPAS